MYVNIIKTTKLIELLNNIFALKYFVQQIVTNTLSHRKYEYSMQLTGLSYYRFIIMWIIHMTMLFPNHEALEVQKISLLVVPVVHYLYIYQNSFMRITSYG